MPRTGRPGFAAGRQSSQSTAAARVSRAASAAKQPTTSKLGANGMTPSGGMRPRVGRKPGTPQYAAGLITDAIVCVPSASGTRPAATAAAEPLLEPPGVWPGARGLPVGPGENIANSVVAVLPAISAPAALSLRTASASAPASTRGGSAEPAVVGRPSTRMTSLTPTGMPYSDGRPG